VRQDEVLLVRDADITKAKTLGQIGDGL